jgi:hypothetical protein
MKHPGGRPRLANPTTSTERARIFRAKDRERRAAIDGFEVRLKALEDKVELLTATPTEEPYTVTT